MKVDRDEVREIFERAGDVCDFFMLKKEGRDNICFVEYDTLDQAKRAMNKLNGERIGNNVIHISEAKPREKKEGEEQKGRHGNFEGNRGNGGRDRGDRGNGNFDKNNNRFSNKGGNDYGERRSSRDEKPRERGEKREFRGDRNDGFRGGNGQNRSEYQKREEYHKTETKPANDFDY